jgi:hypothetical protein
MAAFAWSVAVPASLYITRSLGTTVSQSLLRNPAPEPLDTSIDTDGALASAEAALRLVPISPTATHLRSLVQSSAKRLRELLEAAKERQQRTSFSRMFRAPCFREENSRLRAETETLKSRVHLFLSVMSILPSTSDDYNYCEEDGKEVLTRETLKERTRKLADMNLRRERARASFVRTFARKLSKEEELAHSCDMSDDTESAEFAKSTDATESEDSTEHSTEHSTESEDFTRKVHGGKHTPDSASFLTSALQNMLQ